MTQRVLIVDDSPFIRRMITDWLKAESDLEVVGTASTGEEAVEKAVTLRPDVITLDINMPVNDGIWALEQIMKGAPTAVLMVSSATTEGARETLRALELGAYDFVTKPQGSSSLKFLQSREELIAKVRAARHAKLARPTPIRPVRSTSSVSSSDRVVLIASSTGGPKALALLWETLPAKFPAPILIVQHMPAGFTESFARRLDAIGTVPCREAAPGDKVLPGQAFVAPGGKHMRVRSDGSLSFDTDPPIHGVRPAADYLFLSAVEVYGARCVGVVLTGMGRDGAEGALAIRRAGGATLGEAESTCTIYGMPKAAMTIGAIEAEFPIHEMGRAIVAQLGGRIAHAS